MFSYKQILVGVDTIVSLVIQSRKVSEGGAISVSCHVNWVKTIVIWNLWEIMITHKS